MKRVSYHGGGTVIRRSPTFTRGIWSESGPNAAEGEMNVARAAAKKRAKVLTRIDAMNKKRKR